MSCGSCIEYYAWYAAEYSGMDNGDWNNWEEPEWEDDWTEWEEEEMRDEPWICVEDVHDD